MQEIHITDEYITLGQMLKLTNLFDSGGFIKSYIKDQGVYVNRQLDYRRGRKLYPNDIVQLDDEHVFIIRVKE